MGPVDFIKRKVLHVEEEVADVIQEYVVEASVEVKLQVAFIVIFITVIYAIRTLTPERIRAMKGPQTLVLVNLNTAIYFKEVFLAYLNAALLEPVLAIAGMEQAEGLHLVINLFTIVGICMWIYVVTDAFDYTDVTQQFKYHYDFVTEENKSKYPWLTLRKESKIAMETKLSLVGSIMKDVALWFLLACIAAASLPGLVDHRDVLHAYVIVFMWILLHHFCRDATSWGASYFFTFLFPSAALMPLQYCIPLMDVADTVEDFDFIARYREYIQDITGVELMIVS